MHTLCSPARPPGVAGLVLFAVAVALPLGAQTSAAGGRVSGRVSDSATGAPVSGAVVSLLSGTAAVGTAVTDGTGRYRLVGLQPIAHAMLVSRAGYRTGGTAGVVPSDSGAVVDVQLHRLPLSLDPVVVSATLSPETSFGTPVSTSVIARESIEASHAVTVLDRLRYVPGVDFASKGVATYTFSARGPRGVSASSMLMMSDYRYAGIPYLGVNVAQLLPSTDDDVERIEVARGPGAVIYGPNSRRGVVNVIRRSPLDAPEAVVSVSGGSRSYGDMAFRLSQPFAENAMGLKLSGRYYAVREWPYTDDVEARLREQAIGAGADPATLLLGRREPDTRGVQGDARFDWRPGPATRLATTIGLTQATGIETGAELGAAQAVDWTYGYAQTRLERGDLFVNLSYNWGNAGDSYNLRNGQLITNASRLYAAQVKQDVRLGRSRLQYGADAQWTTPRTDGTLNGRFEDHDRVRETGVYSYLTTALSPRLDLVAALRLDHHNRLEEPWFLSPRAGVVFKPSPSHAVRFVYSRSFEQPAARLMFADFSLGPLGPLPYAIQLHGLGGAPLTVLRDCGGICMRVPGAFGGGTAPQPAVAATMWPIVVGVLQAQGVDLSGLPAPSATDVGTRFGALNFATGAFDDVPASQIRNVPAIQRSEEQVFELGWKGLLSDRVSLGVDLYHLRAARVFASGSAVLTPNVFLDQASLETYLGGFMPPEQAGPLAAGIAQIPVGTVATAQSPTADILVAPFGNQGGSHSHLGVDVFGDIQLSSRLAASASYSWVDRDSVSLGVGSTFLLFNIPRHKAALSLTYLDPGRGVTLTLRGRALGSFSVNTPAYLGVVQEYSAVDASIGLAVPRLSRVRFLLDVANVFNDVHTEMIGSPALGRFVVARLSARY